MLTRATDKRGSQNLHNRSDVLKTAITFTSTVRSQSRGRDTTHDQGRGRGCVMASALCDALGAGESKKRSRRRHPRRRLIALGTICR